MRPDVHLEPGCPWYELSELRLPNVDWCELQRCSWVVEPANTWSNLAYVAVAAILWWLARALPSPQLRFFAPAALLVGVASGIYHASYSFALQILDFLAMYVFCYLLITLNLRRLGVLGAGDWRRRFWQLVVGTTLLTVAVDFLEIPIQGLVFALILVIVGSELRIRLGGRGEPGGVPGTPLPTWPIFSRWLTHLCAPTFVFLAGTALALSLERRSRGGQSAGELDRQIVTRGAIIAALDPTLVSLGSGRLTFQVLYAIGVSMMLMAPLRRLSTPWLVGTALAWMLLGEAITDPLWEQEQGWAPPWVALLMAALVEPGLKIIYPVLPWLAMMALGWAFGRVLVARMAQGDVAGPRRMLLVWGLVGLAVFLLVRGVNDYGNMFLLRQGDAWIQWLHVSKYPPSLAFTALELGLLALGMWALMGLEPRVGVRRNGPLLVFGQTPMFFYLVHRLVLEGAATWLGLRGFAGLAEAYAITLVSLVALYPACRWYRELKRAHPRSLLRFF